MKEDAATIMSKVNPDLLVPPHVLALLMELFGGEIQLVPAQQEQWQGHLAICHYCRTALIFLLGIAQEYDHRNNNPEEPTRDLLIRFTDINREIEAQDARESERMERIGAYAEAIVTEGREKAAEGFPNFAMHLAICSDCRSILEAIVTSLTEPDKID